MLDYPTIKAWLKLPDDSEQAAVVALEERVQAHLEGRLELYLGAPKAVTVLIDGPKRDRIWLPQPVAVEDPPPDPLLTVETADGAGGWTAVAPADFELDDADHREQAVYVVSWGELATWPRGRRNIRVGMRIGYTEGNEPAELRQLALDMISLMYSSRGRLGMESETLDDYSYTRQSGGDDLDDMTLSIPAASSIISRWRRHKL